MFIIKFQSIKFIFKLAPNESSEPSLLIKSLKTEINTKKQPACEQLSGVSEENDLQPKIAFTFRKANAGS